jgi:F-type H+-transporting ATPase subunit c
MIYIAELLYTSLIAIPVALSAIGAGIGQGYIGLKSIRAINTQPQSSTEIIKVALISMAIVETVAIFGTVMSIILLYDNNIPVNVTYAAYGRVGIALAMGISGLCAGIASSFPAQGACESVARQPFFTTKIINLMLITQTFIMTSNIFAFIISLMINNYIATINSFAQGMQYLAAGLSIGLGSIGPSFGLGIFAYSACKALGINRKAFGKIVSFTFISEAIIETPLIFSLLIALQILSSTVSDETSILKGIVFISAALCMGFSTLGTGLATGKTSSEAILQIALQPHHSSIISKVSMIGLVLIDTMAIYGLIISFMMLTFV